MTSVQNMSKHGSEGQYRSDESVSFNQSNVFSLTDADEDVVEFTTISSFASDLIVGLGTYTPSCRLSFGKNTTNVFTNEIVKESLPGVCFNEESDGTDATGITYYERYDADSKERAESGLAFVVNNENFRPVYDGTVFTNTMDVSQNTDIPMSILRRSSGQTTVLINHDPAQTTKRAVFGNERVSLDISGAARVSDFLILGNSTAIVADSTDFNTLNDGTLIFDGTKLYIKQTGVTVPSELLLKTDADSGAAGQFSADVVGGVYQATNTLIGANVISNIFRNAFSVIGNSIFGSDNVYVNNSVLFLGDAANNPTNGILSVEKGIGVNVFTVAAALDISGSTIPYIISGSNNIKEDISQNTVVFGDGNRFVGNKSNVFGDSNMNRGNYTFNIGSNNTNLGNNCFIQGNEHQTNINKSIVFGEFNNIIDSEIISSPNKNQHNFVSGFNNTLRDGSSNYIFGTNIDTSGVSYSTAFGYNTGVSNNIRFAIGTEEFNGNVYTMDISGTIEMEGDIKTLTNKSKSIFDNCDHEITIGNSNTLTLFPGEVANYSDQRLKFNIETIQNPLITISKLRGVRYNRNDVNNENKKHIGLIAQEVEQVVPEVVNGGGGQYNYLSVNYGNLVSLLIESIKELSTKVTVLETENSALKNDVETLKSQMKEVLTKLN